MDGILNFWMDFKSHFLQNLQNKPKGLMPHWLDPIQVLDINKEGDTIKLSFQVPSELHKQWVQNTLLKPLQVYFEKNYHGFLNIQLEVSDLKLPHPQAYTYETTNSLPQEVSFFNPLYTFKNFITGHNSELAYAACLSISQAQKAKESLNPLFIYGPSGLGKTHLLNAVGQETLKNFHGKKTLYLSAERFLNEFISSLKNKKMDFFRNKYRKNLDLLLIDDIQVLAKGQGVQEEFFHTFNELFNKKVQVVICCDQPPHCLSLFQERIKTRFAGGLMVDITYPDTETRLAILKNKVEKKQLHLSIESLNAINQTCKRSVREMEGVISKIKFMTEMNEGRLSFLEIEKILKTLKKDLSTEEIKKRVAAKFGLNYEELNSPSRKKNIVRARQVAMFLVRKYLKKSLKDISQAFDKKDHTTVLNSIKKVEKLSSQDKEFKGFLYSLHQDIHNHYGLN